MRYNSIGYKIVPCMSSQYLYHKSKIITMKAYVHPNGTVEIPAEYRKRYGIKGGEKISIEYDYEHKGILLRPIAKEKLEDYTSKLLADEDKILSKKVGIVSKNILGR